MRQATRIFGSRVIFDEEKDGNIIVAVSEREAERKYGVWIKVWPEGVMTERGIATGIYS